MMSKEEVANSICYYLVDNRKSVRELAQEIGANKASIYRWINGKAQMSNKYYLRLLQVFDGYNPARKWLIQMDEDKMNTYLTDLFN